MPQSYHPNPTIRILVLPLHLSQMWKLFWMDSIISDWKVRNTQQPLNSPLSSPKPSPLYLDHTARYLWQQRWEDARSGGREMPLARMYLWGKQDFKWENCLRLIIEEFLGAIYTWQLSYLKPALSMWHLGRDGGGGISMMDRTIKNRKLQMKRYNGYRIIRKSYPISH